MTADYEAYRRTREERHRQVVTQQLGQIPRELGRCTCNTPSFDAADHATGCALSLSPPLSSNPTRPATRRLPEEMF
ncbi:hypothetical protein [Mycobacterium sp. pR1184]|uniref:hypothetical protein n=1 Tax=Mycobacterium sp. pR1184 TaxID=3238981 RepID=UPI00351AB4D9